MPDPLDTTGKTIQVIFQVYDAPRCKWLDYCREPSPSKHINRTNDWAKDQCTVLDSNMRKPFRFILEIWN